jgi:hypothetical protein
MLPLAARDLPRSLRQLTAEPRGHFQVFKKLRRIDMSIGVSENRSSLHTGKNGSQIRLKKVYCIIRVLHNFCYRDEIN